MIAGLALWLTAATAGAPVATAPVLPAVVEAGLVECDTRAADLGRLPIRCFVALARRERGSRPAVRAHVEERAEQASDPRWRLELGLLWNAAGHEGTEAMLRRATQELRANDDAEGEVNARLALARFFSARSLPAESREQVARVHQLAEAHQQPAWEAMALIESGTQRAGDHHGDLDVGRRQLERALVLLPSDASPRLRAQANLTLAMTAQALGDRHGARDRARRAAGLLAEAGDTYGQAYATLRELWQEAAIHEDATGRWPQDLRDRLREAAVAAKATGNTDVEATLSCLLGEMLTAPEQRLHWVRRCVEVREITGVGVDNARLVYGWNVARFEPGGGPRGRALVDEVLASPSSRADPWTEASALDVRAGLRWSDGDRAGALADWERHFAIIEAIRYRQPDQQVQQAVFAHWAADYLRVSGLLLAASERTPDDVALAFDVMERLRSRQVLDALDESGVTAGHPLTGPAAIQRDDVQREAAALSERLAEQDVDDAERQRLLERLERLDRREQALRQRLALEQPAFARMHQPRRTTLAQIRDALGPDQALLAYQVSFDRGARGRRWGGSWLVAITRQGVGVHRLPDERRIAAAVRRYAADIAARQGFDVQASEQLHQWLVAPALAGLPPGIEQLVIVPDGPLHALPFAALQGPSGPLGVEYGLSRVPSATAWAAHREPVATPERGVLALADPSPLPEDPRGGPSVPLPGTRHEAGLAVSLVGGASALWQGASASEARLVEALLDPFAVLHVGAHTVINESDPRRSAILLSPGQGHDGALRPDELSRLDLSGKLVVLAACEGAGGRLLAGEGPLGPARAAFMGGARTVVASLWPIRDDEALEFFALFYEHLASGETAGASLTHARRTLAARGVPAHAWAGVVMIGDPSLRLRPGPAWFTRPRVLLALALIVFALAALARAVLLRTRTGARRRPAVVEPHRA